MEARNWRGLWVAALALLAMGANYRSPNFVVSAASPEIARQVGELAEQYRRDLAIEWLGKPMPNWARPCPITVQADPKLGAGGVTSFVFDHGEVFGWQMTVQGPLDRVLDSVLPHEVTHTIFASHFRRPLPRWADEGACTTVEHASERRKQQGLLIQFLQTGRGIPFSQMFMMKEYPRDILPLYAQGHSLSTYLIAQGGKRKFMQYVGEGLESEDWIGKTREHYGFNDLAELQTKWLDWVRSGSPRLEENPAVLLAGGSSAAPPRVLRGQSPDSVSGAPAALAPLVPVQRPGRAAPAGSLADHPTPTNSAVVASRDRWVPANPARFQPAGGVIAPPNQSPAATNSTASAPPPIELPGPGAPAVTRQAGAPPASGMIPSPSASGGPSVYAVRPRPGDTLLR